MLPEGMGHMPKTLSKSRVLAWLCLTGLMVPIATRMVPESAHTLAWLIDLASHWQWVFLGGLVLFTAISTWGQKRWAFLLLAVPLPWITASEPAPATDSDAPMLKIAAANVGLKNREPDALLNWLAAQRVDIVALSEVSPAYARKLKSQHSFPFRHIVPRRGPFGLALLSRHPLVDPKVIQDAEGIPSIRMTTHWQGQPVVVTAVHPMPPFSAHYHQARNDRLRAAAREAEPSAKPGILLGDLNISPWSSGMHGPTEEGYRRATGLWPTWPATLKGLLGIPIDQILVTGHWSVNASGTGPVLFSDHLPVWASLSLRTSPDPN